VDVMILQAFYIVVFSLRPPLAAHLLPHGQGRMLGRAHPIPEMPRYQLGRCWRVLKQGEGVPMCIDVTELLRVMSYYGGNQGM